MAESRKLKVFLCHASQDKTVVHGLHQRLLAEGWIDPWLDKVKLLPGQDWELEIEKSVESADIVIVCLSKSSVEKEGFYQKEIKRVLDVADEKPEGTIFIIPLRLDDCQPPRSFMKLQYVDYFPKGNRNEAFTHLAQSLVIRGKSLGIEIKQFTSNTTNAKIEFEPERIPTKTENVTKNSVNEKIIAPAIQKRKLIHHSHRTDHHTALASKQISQASGAGVKFVATKLQWGKDDFGVSLHAEPNSFSTHGMQSTDFLHYLGFRREACSFVSSRECFAAWVEPDIDLLFFVQQFDVAYGLFEKAGRLLESCGHFLDQPEGWGYFNGRPASGRNIRSRLGHSADGHNAKKTELLKQMEDEIFFYRMSWVESASEKGWVFHYRFKNETNDRLSLVLKFLNPKTFHECPYFDFEKCNWVYFQYKDRGDSFFESNANFVHSYFSAHEKHFSQALDMLVKANELLEPFGFRFLN